MLSVHEDFFLVKRDIAQYMNSTVQSCDPDSGFIF